MPSSRSAWLVTLASLLLAPSALRAQITNGPSGPLNVYTLPAADPNRPTNSGPYPVPFWVVNTSGSGLDASFSCSKSGPITCGTVSPTFASINPNDSITVTVNYSSGATTGAGYIQLTATPDIGQGSSGIRNVTVAVNGKGVPSLVTRNVTNIDRGLCLTVGAGEGAGLSCGDLFVVQGMPAYRTLGRDRSLSLYYNSAAATGLTLVAGWVVEPTTIAMPNTIRVILNVNGVKDSVNYAPTFSYPYSYSSPQQVVLGRGLSGLATGYYSATLTIRNIYATATIDSTITGSVLVVNRSGSEYGKGWSLLGVEQVLADPSDSTRKVWVAGDGSIRLYTKKNVGDTVFVGAPGDAPDSLIRYDTLIVGSHQKWFRRNLKHGASVTFDATGRHQVTRNRVGARTTFTWGTVASQTRLLTITVPPNDASTRNYTFYWNGSTAALDSLRDPGGRRLRTVMTSSTLTKLISPDNKDTTRLVYSGNLMTKRIYPRPKMKGDSAYTSYGYANNARVTSVAIQMDSAAAQFSTTVISPWDEKGLTTLVPVDTTIGLPTRVDGPLSGLGDAADIWVDHFGGPTRTTQLGLAATTILWHDSTASLPALVTAVQYPNGRRVRMSWNSRGNLTAVRDSTSRLFSGTPQLNLTSYSYLDSNTPDSPTRVTDALGRHTDYTYTSQGLTDSITDSRGHVTSFGYKASPLVGLVNRITERSVQTWRENVGANDTTDATQDQVRHFDYDANGNIKADTSTTGVVTAYKADTLGRITDVYTPDSSLAHYVYDPMNRDTAVVQYTTAQSAGFSLIPAGCDSTQVVCNTASTWAFNPSLPSTLTTHYVHSVVGVDSVVDARGVRRGFAREARALVARERDDFGRDRTASFNAAALTASTVSRSNHTVTFTYDSIGRKTAMAYPSVAPPGDWADSTVPGDTVRYTYDLMGHLLTATNHLGSITRTYYLDGSLKSKITLVGASLGDTLKYEYDSAGALRHLIHGPDSTVYKYNGTTGDLDTLRVYWAQQAQAVRAFAFQWDALGRRRRITYPNGVKVWMRYDAAGVLRRLVSINPYVPPPTVRDFLDFTLRNTKVDPTGRILEEEHCDGAIDGSGFCFTPKHTSNRYNRLGQLVWQKREPAVGGAQIDSLGYDASGNMTFALRATDLHKYVTNTSTNRLSTDSTICQLCSTINFTYDSNGSRRKGAAAVPNDILDMIYYYDGLGRMTGRRTSRTRRLTRTFPGIASTTPTARWPTRVRAGRPSSRSRAPTAWPP